MASTHTSPRVCVLGLGKLGSCYAAFYAQGGFDVIGYDTDQRKVAAIAAGKPPVAEPELAELITRNRRRLQATNSLPEAIERSDIVFIIVPTPSNKDGSFSTAYVESACAAIGKAFRNKKGFLVVSLVSTVLPGDSRERIIPALERASGKRCGKDFGYSYNPSLIAIGDIINNLRAPDFLFLGPSDPKTARIMRGVYARLYPDRAVEEMSIESVELSKIALNSFVTTKLTFANMLGELCETIPNANVDHVTTALGKDSRIGKRYFSAGLGYGGPCFPRDNFAFASMAKRYGVTTPLPLATHTANEAIPARMGARVAALAKARKARTIGFLGISYKPRTTLTEESQAHRIALSLRKKGYALAIYEPLGTEDAKRVMGKTRVSYPTSLAQLAQMSDIIFISNPDARFKGLPGALKRANRRVVVVDPWGLFKAAQFGPKVEYLALGRGR